MKTSTTAAVLAALAFGAWAQQPAAPVTVTPVRGNIYFASGGAGSNSGIIIGANGVILVDTKTSVESEKEVIAAVAKLTPKPITTVLVTHSDGDHVNGIAALQAGVKVIAHQGAKKEMETALAAGGRGAPPKEAIPTQVVATNREDLTIDGVRLSLYHWTNAHTSGDLIVVDNDQKVGFGGDIIATNRPDPIIHPEKNGSSLGWNETVRGMLSLDADTWVPGHGVLQTKDDLRKRLAATEEKRAKIAAMVAQGKSLDDVKAALGEPPAAPAPGGRGGLPGYTETVYQELARK